MAEAHPSGRQSAIQCPMSSLDGDIPSTTIQEGESPSEGENLVLLLSRHIDTDNWLTTALLHNYGPLLTRSDRTLRSWCYGLHAFLVAIHVALVGMLFTHPEHRFSVSINNTAATIALKVFLQAFYTVCLHELVLWILM